MTELVKKKWVKLEDLGTLGDLGGIHLSTIFADVAKRYEAQVGDRLLHWIGHQPTPSRFSQSDVVDLRAALDNQLLSDLAVAEQNAFAVRDIDCLTFIFRSGRLLDSQCLASRKTEQYLMLQTIVNDVLYERGFQDFHIY